MKALTFAAVATVAAATQCPPDTCAHSSPARFAVPSAYEAYVAFKMPYFNFTEKAYIWGTNRGGGALRLSYNGGANIFIQNNISTHTSFQLYPAEQSLLCSKTPFSGFSDPFPNLNLFCRDNVFSTGCPTAVTVNGVQAHRYTYSYTDPRTGNDGKYNYDLPDNNAPGYRGVYHWYQDARTGAPIRFHVVLGHSVVFGGSHVDEYILDYMFFRESPLWPEEEFFAPPKHMPCEETENPFGPTTDVRKVRSTLSSYGAHEPTDYLSLFPEGAERRRVVADAHAAAHGDLLDGQRHDNEAMLRLHSTARYVSARNRELRASGASYTVGLNGLSHMTNTERRRHLTGYRATAHKATAKDHARVRALRGNMKARALGPDQPEDECTVHKMSGKKLPAEVDLNKYSFPPKDQGNCGSCWAFGATGAIEGAFWSVTGKEPHRASEQHLLDCTWYYGNNACEGGNDYTAFSWMIRHNQGKIATDNMYGDYLNKNSFCRFDIARNWTIPGKEDVLQIAGCVHVNDAYEGETGTGEELVPSLMDALHVMQRPMAVAIDASNPDFYYYTGGLYYNPECGNDLDDLDHEVLVVGYKTVNGQTAFHLKNSWSDRWGEKGYIWVSTKNNNCGVATSPNYILTPQEVKQ